jgi:predicted heme/steroid binding protein
MEPERLVSRQELRRSTGERGTPMWVAVAGIVYDVSCVIAGAARTHEGQRFLGQELTQEFTKHRMGGGSPSWSVASGCLKTDRHSTD